MAINYRSIRRKDLVELEHRHYTDYKRVIELYDKWDVAARDKDFHNAEHFDYMIKKIFSRNGLVER